MAENMGDDHGYVTDGTASIVVREHRCMQNLRVKICAYVHLSYDGEGGRDVSHG